MEKLCAWLPTSINWEAIAAIATLSAVFLALLPIWKEARRAAAQARNLRIRIGSKLIILQKSLVSLPSRSLSYRKSETEVIPSGVLSPSEFLIYVRELDAILGESVVLTPEEQNQLARSMLNIDLLAPLYCQGTATPRMVQDVLEQINKTIKCFEKHSLPNIES